MSSAKALVAEFIGTFWLVLGGCGAAVLAADFGTGGNGTSLGIGFVGVSLAFGLTVVTGAYALGHVSGGHFNPAVTLGLAIAGKFSTGKLIGYWFAQVIGAFVAALVIYVIASGVDGFAIADTAGAFATNGFASDSFTGDGNFYSLGAVLVAEIVLTAIFLIIILGATDKAASAAMGGLAIGLGLTLIHLISIPVSNTSVNPARSTSQALGQAIFGDGQSIALEQLWVFWLAPLVGAIVGAAIYRVALSSDVSEIDLSADGVKEMAKDVKDDMADA